MSRDRNQPRSGRLARWVRGVRFDRNPLRRGTDRAETGVLILLVTVLLVGAPLIAAACGVFVHGIAERNLTAQHASHYQVTATLLTAASPRSGDASAVRARWTAPDGKSVTGDVYVTTGMPVGAVVTEWVLRDGELALAPLVPSQVTGQADLAMVFGAICYALVLAVGGLLARVSIDRRRMAAWDSAWLARGPRGTPRI